MLIRKIIFAFLLLPQFLLAQQKATITEESREMITYPYGDPNPIPILADKNFRIYPYFTFDGYSQTAQRKNWKVITLENDYIKVFITP